MNKDAQMRATINQKLIETGERERLKELLRAKLIECGWKDQLKAHCKGNLDSPKCIFTSLADSDFLKFPLIWTSL
uniref:ENY2 transcription and export complex 2 subunit n=1 Tax=Gopherus evgoodei TaxID=1825980 RepID=A0A8C4WLI1_9SAUR